MNILQNIDNYNNTPSQIEILFSSIENYMIVSHKPTKAFSVKCLSCNDVIQFHTGIPKKTCNKCKEQAILGYAPKSKLEGRWCAMFERCYLHSHPSYKNYGGKGVTVCDEWLDFKTYKSWMLARGYYEGCTLQVDKDFLSIDKGLDVPTYSPTTCLLITRATNLKLRKFFVST